MPGWDYPIRVRGENGRRAAAALSSMGALAGVAGWAASTMPFVAAAALPAAVLAALFFAVALGAALGVVPIAGAYRARRIRRTRFPTPLLRVGLVPRAPRGSHQMVAQDGTVVRLPEHGGDYPVSRTAFVIGPLQAIALTAPHAGAASGAGQSKLRVAPPALRERVGPVLGVSDGESVYLSERDRYSGRFMSGGPGGGKTLFLLTLWGYDAFALFVLLVDLRRQTAADGFDLLGRCGDVAALGVAAGFDDRAFQLPVLGAELLEAVRTQRPELHARRPRGRHRGCPPSPRPPAHCGHWLAARRYRRKDDLGLARALGDPADRQTGMRTGCRPTATSLLSRRRSTHVEPEP